ncbi:unnamed protein product [Tilletia laevis]|nr:hypothetical protein CF335_g547 [Tilletia laevis]KAE8264986.1 hypothetical protein A4X03_0g565 [Tilletia caries]CAD6922714.1 unnamed protein product [Tilletia controversa]CAD6909008.1 unnamed protein product [Tilletia laevis]CAD6938905.1 unnamed protein product [Tilletia caries]
MFAPSATVLRPVTRITPSSHAWIGRGPAFRQCTAKIVASSRLTSTSLDCRSYSNTSDAASASNEAPQASIPQPLAGIRVLDLTRILAGPASTMLLSDLGADVIKVEHPKGGDDTRSWGPPFAPAPQSDQEALAVAQKAGVSQPSPHWKDLPPESAYFLCVNRGKRSITVDMKKPEGREVLHNLVKAADVLVENYLPGKLKSYGLDYDSCNKLNPGLVYASITGYGQTGPYATSPGYDVVIAADAGLMHITGEADRPPVKIGVAMTDLTTGLYTHGAIMAALLGRAKTGKGVHIDASLFESQIASLANIASNYLVAGVEAGRHGTAHPSIAPYQVFPTKDGFIMIGAGNDGQFKTLTRLLGAPKLATDPRFLTNGDRVANRDVLISLLNDLLSQQTSEQWLDLFRNAPPPHFPVAPIRDMRGTFEHPQTQARGMTQIMNHPRAGEIKVVSPAVSYGGGKMPLSRPPPVLGQHNDEVLSELGYSNADIARLRQEGAIGQ